MKSIIFIFCFIIFVPLFAYAQYVVDTLGTNSISGAGVLDAHISNCNAKSCFVFQPYELAQKGIVPGDTIYGIGFHKALPNNYLLPNAVASLDIRFRSGSQDSFFTIVNNVFSLNSQLIYNAVAGYFPPQGFSNSAVFTTGNNLMIPDSSGWFSFMLDIPFVYTGGPLEVFTIWQISPNSTSGIIKMSDYVGVSPNQITKMATVYCNSAVGGGGQKPASIIYHSTNPPACSGMPISGIITHSNYICVDKDFLLYLNNPSAGPGITYQWQKCPITSSSWTNISGATLPSCIANINTPQQFRCKITCSNSGLSSICQPVTIYPFTIHIDSVTHQIHGDTLSVQVYSNDTIGPPLTVPYIDFGDNIGPSFPPLSHAYTVDGTYQVKIVVNGVCSSDSLSFPITIGCAGSPTFVNTISAVKDTTCLSKPATLKINDTLPNNYTVQWYRFTWSGNILLGNSTVGNYNVPVTAPSDIFWCKAICNISGNYKYSNYDTIYITPPPTAGSITATNSTGNYYSFTNNGMSNAQSYTWYFGDGDSSSSLSPSHHYNLAGTYTVHFVTYNTGNGCTDTATTTVNITTGIEEIQGKLFSVSPNPFKESFTVNCPSGKGIITVMDAMGKVVKSVVVKSQALNVELKGLSVGVYLVRYENDSQTETIKIIKE